MSRFAADWLFLREQRDHASRYPFVRELADLRQRSPEIHALDLGAGTGSNFRFLAPRLGTTQHWVCIDNDADLLDAMHARLVGWHDENGMAVDIEAAGAELRVQGASFTARIARRQCELAQGLDDIEFRAGALITCSALLDLVSSRWLEALVGHCRAAASPLLCALSYSGTIVCTPEHPDDGLIERLVNAHQLTDKGFGPALGPAATDVMSDMLRDARYAVTSAQANWSIPATEADLQIALLDGWRVAAAQMEPAETDRIAAWRDERLRLVREGRSRISVSHVDLFASPTA